MVSDHLCEAKCQCTYMNGFCKHLITELVCAFLPRPTHTHGPGVLDAAGLCFLGITVPSTYHLTESILDKSHQAEMDIWYHLLTFLNKTESGVVSNIMKHFLYCKRVMIEILPQTQQGWCPPFRTLSTGLDLIPVLWTGTGHREGHRWFCTPLGGLERNHYGFCVHWGSWNVGHEQVLKVTVDLSFSPLAPGCFPFSGDTNPTTIPSTECSCGELGGQYGQTGLHNPDSKSCIQQW